MPDPTAATRNTLRVPPEVERLGAANELLAQYCDPASALQLGERLDPGYVVERFRTHLDREAAYQLAAGWSAVAVYGVTPPVVASALARSIPWPAHATGGLWPGDVVGHALYGEGRLAGFDDAQWPAVLHLVAAGHVLVKFEDGEHWVASATLTKCPQPAPCDPGSPY